jgi:hypothetical protein
MMVKETVLYLENKSGELSRIIAHLYDNDVTVTAFWIGTENDQTMLRFVANDPESAISLLTGLALDAHTADAIIAHIPSHPGGLNSLLKVLATAQIDIHHIYPGISEKNAIVVLHVDDPDKAVSALKENWIRLQ